MIGRPTVMTEETLRKLEDAFLMGCTDAEACLFAGIGKRTLYDYQAENEDFSHQKEVMKTNPSLQAKHVQLKELQSGSFDAATKYLNREASKKVEITGESGGAIALNFIGVGDGPPSS